MATTKEAGIYRIVVRRKDKCDVYYFGQTADLTERWKQHLRALRARRHDNVRLQRLFEKYGESSFSFEGLLVCAPVKDVLTLYEQAILNFYLELHGDRVVLNVMRECVNSHLGVKRRPESIAKLRAAVTGKKRTPEQNAANSVRRKGSTHTAETRKKLSAIRRSKPQHPNSLAGLERVRSSTRLDALRLALVGKPKIHSEATKQKIAATLTGRKQSDDLIEKRVAPLRGRKQTKEQIAKRVASRLANAKTKMEARV